MVDQESVAVGKERFKGKSILIVDDDPDIVAAIQTAFAETGADLATARDGQAAMNLAAERDPDLIILDIMMPKKGGLMVLEKLKKVRGGRPHIIMITGNTGNRHQSYAEAMGADAYLRKPVAMEILLDTAQKVLAKD